MRDWAWRRVASVRPRRVTEQPSKYRRRAMARPMPEPPPVMRACLFRRVRIFGRVRRVGLGNWGCRERIGYDEVVIWRSGGR